MKEREPIRACDICTSLEPSRQMKLIHEKNPRFTRTARPLRAKKFTAYTSKRLYKYKRPQNDNVGTQTIKISYSKTREIKAKRAFREFTMRR